MYRYRRNQGWVILNAPDWYVYIGQITVLEVTVEVNFKCSKLWQEYFCAQYGRWAVFGILVWKANNSLVLNKLLFQLY